MKTVFITGGSTGIGAAAVAKFAAKGWNVAFMDVNPRPETPAKKRDNILFSEGDTRSRADLDRAVKAATERFGAIDSLIVNAGIHRNNRLLDVDDAEMDMMIDINIKGSINTLRAVVPEIIKAGGGSVVINCSDQWFIGKPGNFIYGMTKGALGQITRSLALELAPYSIRVNAVCPGTIHTPLVDHIFELQSAKTGKSVECLWEEENTLFARGSAGTPEEVANLMYFLASDEASFCTGGHYLVDGGLTAG